MNVAKGRKLTDRLALMPPTISLSNLQWSQSFKKPRGIPLLLTSSARSSAWSSMRIFAQLISPCRTPAFSHAILQAEGVTGQDYSQNARDSRYDSRTNHSMKEKSHHLSPRFICLKRTTDLAHSNSTMDSRTKPPREKILCPSLL